MAYLNLPTIFTMDKENYRNAITEARKEYELYQHIILPPIIGSVNDFDHIKYYVPKPNFITKKIIVGAITVVNSVYSNPATISGKIIVLENGDPGYDWIFLHAPAGVVTKYGGIASHMAIRCAELGIPAAIGCGEPLFHAITKEPFLFLDCSAKIITTLPFSPL